MVKIEGLSGWCRVLGKINKRWTKKIDLYMGLDRDSALQWGRREVWISWEEKE
jgi:3D (Asp-Asp-Asp) domain-containing protein